MSRQKTDNDEFSLIERFFAPLAKDAPGAVGLHDDTASIDISRGHVPVVTLDTLVAGVHFFAEDPPDLIARKLLRVSLSDLASSGATPVGYFLSLSLPREIEESWIAQFVDGLKSDQETYGILLHGGDTTSTPGPVSLSLTAIGEAKPDRIVRRSGARSNDDIYVTGTIGDSALGLELINSMGVEQAGGQYPVLVDQYRLPEPRVGFGLELAEVASAAIDVSDGLLADAGHIANASSVSLCLEQASIPLSCDATALLKDNESLIEKIISGGDDYEILFCAAPDRAQQVKTLSERTGTVVTRIGSVEEGTGKAVLQDAAGNIIEPAQAGWKHF